MESMDRKKISDDKKAEIKAAAREKCKSQPTKPKPKFVGTGCTLNEDKLSHNQT